MTTVAAVTAKEKNSALFQQKPKIGQVPNRGHEKQTSESDFEKVLPPKKQRKFICPHPLCFGKHTFNTNGHDWYNHDLKRSTVVRFLSDRMA